MLESREPKSRKKKLGEIRWFTQMVLCRLLYDKNVISFYDSNYYYHQSINQEALILLSGYVISFLVFWYFGDPWPDAIEINPFFHGKSRISIPQEWDEWGYLLFWVGDYRPLILGLTFRAWCQALRLSISSTPLPSHPLLHSIYHLPTPSEKLSLHMNNLSLGNTTHQWQMYRTHKEKAEEAQSLGSKTQILT